METNYELQQYGLIDSKNGNKLVDFVEAENIVKAADAFLETGTMKCGCYIINLTEILRGV